jgi:hypothetical protein
VQGLPCEEEEVIEEEKELLDAMNQTEESGPDVDSAAVQTYEKAEAE